MKNLVLLAVVLCLTAVMAYPVSAEETPAQCKLRLMQITKLAGICEEAAPNFVMDSDPDTLEIVFLPKGSTRPSSVSDDAQVMYLNQPTEDEQQKLIQSAFDKRVQLGFWQKAVPSK